MALSVAPSESWDGNDGPWSTFTITIGTPPTTLRLLPATSGSAIWAVAAEGCSNTTDPLPNCAQNRGGLYRYANSSSFQSLADRLWGLPFESEKNLPQWDAIPSQPGADTVILGLPGGNGPTLEKQVVLAYARETPVYMGVLPLTARSANITSLFDTHDSLLQTLRKQNKVSSSYWGYTAGARYRTPGYSGSLTFGGYDALRGNQNNVLTVAFGTDISRDLLVSINDIDIEGEVGAAAGLPIYAYLDSVVPEIWLPKSACAVFEQAFGLVWNDTVSTYFVNDTQHDTLVRQNKSVTLTLGSTPNDRGINITFPYASFDLQASFGYAGIKDNSTRRYFPLKQAANESQYTLGRTFFQEAYVAADYDRSVFHVSPATFPPQPGMQDIKTPGTSSRLSPGAIAGIVIGAVALSLLLIAAAYFFFIRPARRKSLTQSSPKSDNHSFLKPELDAVSNTIAPSSMQISSTGSIAPGSSWDGSGTITSQYTALASPITSHPWDDKELPPIAQEMDATQRQIHEVPSTELRAKYNQSHISELPGSTPRLPDVSPLEPKGEAALRTDGLRILKTLH